MIEDCDVEFTPFFANTTMSQYKVKGTDRTVSCKTRSVSSVQSKETAANELFADNLWPGCFVMADILATNPRICVGKNVLELGAGCALPSVVAGVLNSNIVVATDYPEQSVIDNMSEVLQINHIKQGRAMSHKWGDAVEELTHCIEGKKFDVLLLAEVLWKDTYPLHELLLQSVSKLLNKDGGIAIMTFVHRETDTHKAAHDLEFFVRAEGMFGLKSKCMGECNKYSDVFEENECGTAVVNIYVLYFDANIDNLCV